MGLTEFALSLSLISAMVSAGRDTGAAPVWDPVIWVAQATVGTAGSATADNLQGIGLTDSHKRIIYEGTASEQEQTLSGDARVAVGSVVPDSIILNPMPIAVKDQVGLLKDFRFVKLAGANILIVDPATRKIMDIVTKE